MAAPRSAGSWFGGAVSPTSAASTSAIAAPGAAACAHSTSIVISSPHARSVPGDPSFWTVNDGGSGRPNVASNVCRSAWIVGWSKASTIAISVPEPVRPRLPRR